MRTNNTIKSKFFSTARRGVVFSRYIMLITLKCTVFIAFFISSCQKNDKTTPELKELQEVNIVNTLGTVIHITPEQFEQLRTNDPHLLIVDIRTEEELNGQYPKLYNAVHIKDDIIYKNPDTLLRNKSIVIMCLSGHRSSRLTGFLKTQGRTVYELAGGLKNYYRWKNNDKFEISKETPESEQDIENEKGC